MIYYESELRHHGVKGMKWGVRKNPDRMSFSQRRAAKKELRAKYKSDKSLARENYEHATNSIKRDYRTKAAKAESIYDKSTAPAAKKRDEALAKQNRSYETLKKQTDSYYKREIDSHMSKAEEHDADADWWGRDSTFGREHASKSEKHLNDAVKAEQRHNEATAKNIADHESKTIEINAKYEHETRSATEKYTAALDKANSERAERWYKAGEEYARSVKTAKLNYKQAKKDLRRK